MSYRIERGITGGTCLKYPAQPTFFFCLCLLVNCFDGELVVEVIVGGIPPFEPTEEITFYDLTATNSSNFIPSNYSNKKSVVGSIILSPFTQNYGL